MNKALKLAPLLLAVVLFGCNPGGDTDTPGGTTDGGPPTTPNPPTTDDGLAPMGSFGVSATQDGEFLSDAEGNITSASDPRVISVAAGGTFYAQVDYSDPGGISSIAIRIANSSPAELGATLAEGESVGGFTLGSEVSGCVLDGSQTTVSCVYPVAVDDETESIADLDGAEGEFAYVFRTNVTDAAGNESNTPPRGYVTVGGSGGGTDGGTTGGTTGTTTGTPTTTTTGGTTTGGTTTGDTDGDDTTTGGTTTPPTTTGGTTGTTTTGGTDDGDTDDGDTTTGGTSGTTGIPTTTGGTTAVPTTTGGTDDGGTDDGGTDDDGL